VRINHRGTALAVSVEAIDKLKAERDEECQAEKHIGPDAHALDVPRSWMT